MLEAARSALGARRLVRVCTHCTPVCSLMSDMSCQYVNKESAHYVMYLQMCSAARWRAPTVHQGHGRKAAALPCTHCKQPDLLHREWCLNSSHQWRRLGAAQGDVAAAARRLIDHAPEIRGAVDLTGGNCISSQRLPAL